MCTFLSLLSSLGLQNVFFSRTILRTLGRTGEFQSLPTFGELLSPYLYYSIWQPLLKWMKMKSNALLFFSVTPATCQVLNGSRWPEATLDCVDHLFHLSRRFSGSCWLVSSFYVAGTLWTVVSVVISTSDSSLLCIMQHGSSPLALWASFLVSSELTLDFRRGLLENRVGDVGIPWAVSLLFSWCPDLTATALACPQLCACSHSYSETWSNDIIPFTQKKEK